VSVLGNKSISEGNDLGEVAVSIVGNTFKFPVGDDLEVSDTSAEEDKLAAERVLSSCLLDGQVEVLLHCLVSGKSGLVLTLILDLVDELLVSLHDGGDEIGPHHFSVSFTFLDDGRSHSIQTDLIGGLYFSVGRIGVTDGNPLFKVLDPLIDNFFTFVKAVLVVFPSKLCGDLIHWKRSKSSADSCPIITEMIDHLVHGRLSDVETSPHLKFVAKRSNTVLEEIVPVALGFGSLCLNKVSLFVHSHLLEGEHAGF